MYGDVKVGSKLNAVIRNCYLKKLFITCSYFIRPEFQYVIHSFV